MAKAPELSESTGDQLKAPFYLRTLGELALIDETGMPVRLRTRKSLLLLACLTSRSDEACTREWLAGVIWSDRGDEQARNSLRGALSDIRRVVGASAIVTDGGSVRISRKAITSDLDALRRLAESNDAEDPGALRKFYAGDFLTDIYDEILASDWLGSVRAEARELATSILERVTEHLADTGQSKIAILRARELLSLDPLSENSHRRLMLLYNSCGERSKAIAQFNSCRELLRHELGVEPSDETQQVADHIALRDETVLPNLKEITSRNQPGQAGANRASFNNTQRRIQTGSIAVLPFVNMSGDAGQDYFAEGFSEDIVTDLAKVEGLSISAAGSTRMYRATTMRPDEIAGELGVQYLLEGSVRRSEELVRITISLIDGGNNRQVWGERFDRKITRIFDVQAEISTNVARAVQSKVSPESIEKSVKRGTTSVEAHERYLQGRALIKDMTRSGVELAKTFFEQAIEIDGEYALAYAGLAESFSMLGWHYEADKMLLEKAIVYAQKALHIDPGLAEAHCSLGRCNSLFLKVSQAEGDFQRAIDISPNLQEAYLYRALMYLTAGRPEDAIKPLRQALRLDEQDLHTGMMLMNCEQALNADVELAGTAGRVLELAKRRMGLNPYDDQAAYVGAMALGHVGELSEALRWAQIAASYDIDDPRWAYNVACLFAILGETEPALRFLKKTIELGVPKAKLDWIRHHDIDWVNLRGNPRFNGIVGCVAVGGADC